MPSEVHIATQNYVLAQLAAYLPEKEVYFPSIGRYADISIASKNIVIEIQCSFISKEEVQARCSDYGKLGYHVLWIFHTASFGKNYPSEAERFLSQQECYYTNITKQGGALFDVLRMPRGGRVKKVFWIDISTITPFIHTFSTMQEKPMAKFFCKGDRIDALLHEKGAQRPLFAKDFIQKAKKRVRLYFEREFRKHTRRY